LAEHRSPSQLALRTVFACAILFPAVCAAQESPNLNPSEPRTDAAGCADLTVFPKLAGSTILSCDRGDSMEVAMPLGPDAQGFAREKKARGGYEYRQYRSPQGYAPEQVFQNLMQLAPMAGFILKYSAQPSTITARKGDTWILINVTGDSYDVSAVSVKAEPWTSVTTAEEISREMQAHNRVEIYGIKFFATGQSLMEEESPILFEMLKYLKRNPDLSVVIESHKVSTAGAPEDDLEITRERANAVMDWLIAHGIARTRLQPRPFGRINPLTENESPSEIQRNERIVLAKATT
jgi:hypothetical protein